MKESNKASTSREGRFLRAWRNTDHIRDARVHLSMALLMYERDVISEEWDGDIPFALERDPRTIDIPVLFQPPEGDRGWGFKKNPSS